MNDLFCQVPPLWQIRSRIKTGLTGSFGIRSQNWTLLKELRVLKYCWNQHLKDSLSCHRLSISLQDRNITEMVPEQNRYSFQEQCRHDSLLLQLVNPACTLDGLLSAHLLLKRYCYFGPHWSIYIYTNSSSIYFISERRKKKTTQTIHCGLKDIYCIAHCTVDSLTASYQ